MNWKISFFLSSNSENLKKKWNLIFSTRSSQLWSTVESSHMHWHILSTHNIPNAFVSQGQDIFWPIFGYLWVIRKIVSLSPFLSCKKSLFNTRVSQNTVLCAKKNRNPTQSPSLNIRPCTSGRTNHVFGSLMTTLSVHIDQLQKSST